MRVRLGGEHSTHMWPMCSQNKWIENVASLLLESPRHVVCANLSWCSTKSFKRIEKGHGCVEVGVEHGRDAGTKGTCSYTHAKGQTHSWWQDGRHGDAMGRR